MLPKKGLCMPFSVWLIFLASWRSSAGHVVGTQRTTIDPAVNVVVIQAFQNKFEWKRPRNWKIPVHFLVYDLFSRVSNLTLLEELCLEQYKASVCVCVCVCVYLKKFGAFNKVWVRIIFSCVYECSDVFNSLQPHQTPLSLEFSRREYWSGLPFPSLGDFLTQGLNPNLFHLLHGMWILYHFTTWKHLSYLCLTEPYSVLGTGSTQ